MVIDYAANIRQVPVYDLSDRLVSVREYNGTDISTNNLRTAVNYTYASKTNYLTSKSVTIPVSTWTTYYAYGKFENGQMPDQVYTVSYSAGFKMQYTYDALGRRMTESVLYNNANIYANSYTYKDGAGANQTSTQVATYSTLNGTYSYAYDGNGNITQISFAPAGGGAAKLTRYEYDALNRLTREDNPFTNKTYTVSYDLNGNIVNKKTYSYTTGTLPSSATSTIVYSYDDATWRDKLTKYGNANITYDAIGNPTNIGGNVLQWTGRMLDSYTDALNLCEYTYDLNGQRFRKSINGETTEFYYADGQLAAQTWDGKRLLFRYDENGSPVNVYYHDGTTGRNYTYIKNLQGDIVAITNSAGTIVATYTYDAWGKIRASTDTDSLHIGTINPLRYRGYYYDTETGFYYLNSRYYNPTWGRFINADSIAGANQDLQSYNLFAYCSDNPVNCSDLSGNGKIWNAVKTVIKSAIKWVSKKIIQPSFYGYKQRRQRVKATKTIGITGNGAFGFAMSYNLGCTFDSQGNFAVQATGNVGGGTPNVSIVGLYCTVTNAPSYSNLNDWGFQCGGSVTIKPIAFGIEYVQTLPNNNSSTVFHGISINGSYSNTVLWVEGHGEIGKTFTIYQINIFNLMEDTFNEIENW